MPEPVFGKKLKLVFDEMDIRKRETPIIEQYIPDFHIPRNASKFLKELEELKEAPLIEQMNQKEILQAVSGKQVIEQDILRVWKSLKNPSSGMSLCSGMSLKHYKVLLVL